MQTDSSGASLPAPVPVPVPVAPSERTRVVELLQTAFAHDHLSMDEFERRVSVAYQARTASEVTALVADLERMLPLTAAASQPNAAQLQAQQRAQHEARIVTIFSNNERNGVMTVPRRLEIVVVFGNVELDLRDSTFMSGVTEIDVSAAFGNVELTLPLGVRVENSGSAFMGSFDHHSAGPSGYAIDAAHTIRITGHAVFSSVEIGAAPPAFPRDRQPPYDAPRRLA